MTREATIAALEALGDRVLRLDDGRLVALSREHRHRKSFAEAGLPVPEDLAEAAAAHRLLGLDLRSL